MEIPVSAGIGMPRVPVTLVSIRDGLRLCGTSSIGPPDSARMRVSASSATSNTHTVNTAVASGIPLSRRNAVTTIVANIRPARAVRSDTASVDAWACAPRLRLQARRQALSRLRLLPHSATSPSASRPPYA